MFSNILANTERTSEQWMTLQEASKITGRTPASLRMLIKRNKFVRVKRERKKQRDYWLIHRDELGTMGEHVLNNVNVMQVKRTVPEECSQINRTCSEQVNLITVEYYDSQRKEWERETNKQRTEWEEVRSQLEQGLMMYRYKYEELDRKMRLLPAPPEMMSEEIRKKNEIIEELAQAKIVIQAEVSYREQLSSVLHEQEARLIQFQAELEVEKKKPWWKKLLGLK